MILHHQEDINNDIEELKDNTLDPHKLLELSVKQFIYSKGVKLQYQDMENQLLPGFIAEEVAEISKCCNT